MALLKCKDCGNQISSEAESCPNCGRKRPKQTSVVTWIVLAFVVTGIFNAILSSNQSDKREAAEAQAKAAKLAAMTPEQRAAQSKYEADMAAMKARVAQAHVKDDQALAGFKLAAAANGMSKADTDEALRHLDRAISEAAAAK